MSYPRDKRERFLIGKCKGKKRSRSYWIYLDGLFETESYKEVIEKWSQRRRNTTKSCSCIMCGNPRKFFGELTLQERKYSRV